MKKYETYKDTSLPWINEVPSHWQMIRNKNVFTESKETVGDEAPNYKLLSLTLNGIIPRDISSGKGKFPADFNTYKIVKPDDIAFCLFDIDETPRTVGLSTLKGMLTGAYTIFHVNNINPRFLFYYYLSLDNIKALKPLYTGLRKTISTDVFLGTKLPIPPRDEQDQIVRYLDWMVSEINKLIVIKKKEITLISEQRNTAVANVTTRGINTTVKLKESGHSWIGLIPQHWNMVYSKKLFLQRKEKAYKCDEMLTSSQKYGIILQSDFMSLEGRRLTVVLKGDDILKHVNKGDFIISMRSFQGGLEYSYVNGKISSAYVMLIPNHECVYDEYYKWLLKSLPYIKALQGTSDLVRDGQALRYANFAKVYLPSLPLEEQKQIADYLNQYTKKLDSMIPKIEEEINHLHELRASVISDVVTGRVDVRHVDIPDFELVDEIDTDEEFPDGEIDPSEVNEQ